MHRRLALFFILTFLVTLASAINAGSVWDESFHIKLTRAAGVSRFALQPDGRLVIVGEFTEVEGVPRKGIARLNVDGSVDQSFNPGTNFTGRVMFVAAQPDGKVLIGASIDYRFWIIRFNSDGTLDPSFDFGSGIEASVFSSGDVYEMLLLKNGQILAGGNFNFARGQNLNCLARFNPDGTLDSSFSANSSFGIFESVTHLYERDDGDVFFTSADWGGIIMSFGFGRLSLDGSVDPTVSLRTGSPVRVDTLTFASEGRLILFGEFYGLDGPQPRYAVRLNPDNSLDPRFSLPLDFWPSVTTPLADGRTMLINIGSPVMLLDKNGDLDSGFSDVGVISGTDVHLQADGRIVATGTAPILRNSKVNFGLVRVFRDGTVDSTFSMPEGTMSLCSGFQKVVYCPNGRVLLRSDDAFYANGRGITPPITRFLSNGDIDHAFTYSGPPLDGETPMTVQTDGKVLLANFGSVSRIIKSGQLDSGFNCWLSCEMASEMVQIPTQASNGWVARRADYGHTLFSSEPGGLLLRTEASRFNCFPDDTLYSKISKTSAGGGVSPDFTPVIVRQSPDPFSQPPEVRSLLPWGWKGMSCLAGHFDSLNGVPCTNVARILSNGRLDPDFRPAISVPVFCAAILPWQDLVVLLEDGSIMVIAPSGRIRKRTVLQGGMPNGARSAFFAPDHTLLLCSFPTNESLLLVQRFTLLGVLRGSCRAAVNPDQFRVTMQADGHLLISGTFPEMVGVSSSGIRRLSTNALRSVQP